MQQALYGETVAEVNQGTRRYQLVVRLAPEERERIEQVRDLQLRGLGGTTVRLGAVADIGPERASNLIAREGAQRKAVVSCNIAEGHNLGQLVDQVRARVDPLVHQAGYSVHYGGQFEAQQSAARTIYVTGLVVVVVMMILLQLSTGSLRAALLVMVNLPLAVVVLGGLVTSTFLNVIVVPAGYSLIFGLRLRTDAPRGLLGRIASSLRRLVRGPA